jgi:hypothetical protein
VRGRHRVVVADDGQVPQAGALSTHDPQAPQAGPHCPPADLAVSHHGLGGGALSTYYTVFTVTNLSAHAC